jgi:hypothetical protein
VAYICTTCDNIKKNPALSSTVCSPHNKYQNSINHLVFQKLTNKDFLAIASDIFWLMLALTSAPIDLNVTGGTNRCTQIPAKRTRSVNHALRCFHRTPKKSVKLTRCMTADADRCGRLCVTLQLSYHDYSKLQEKPRRRFRPLMTALNIVLSARKPKVFPLLINTTAYRHTGSGGKAP